MARNNTEKIKKLGEKGKVRAILKYVNSKDSDERAAAAAALGHSTDDDAYNALTTLLRDPEIPVRINAAYALKAMGRSSAVSYLRSAAQNTSDAALIAACNDAATAVSEGDKQ